MGLRHRRTRNGFSAAARSAATASCCERAAARRAITCWCLRPTRCISTTRGTSAACAAPAVSTSKCATRSCRESRAVGYLIQENPPRPLYQFPQFALLALGIAAVALGVARGAIDELSRSHPTKCAPAVTASLASRVHAQMEVATAEATLRSARAFYYEAIDAAWQQAQRGDADSARTTPRHAPRHHARGAGIGARGRCDVHARRRQFGVRHERSAAPVPRRARRDAAHHGGADHARNGRPPAARRPDEYADVCRSGESVVAAASRIPIYSGHPRPKRIYAVGRATRNPWKTEVFRLSSATGQGGASQEPDRKTARGEALFPGIVGYDDTVLPQLQNALLSGQDLILLGERGQAKSRILRSLVALLDEWTPVLEGIEIPENPFDPISAQGKQLVASKGDATPIRWMHRDERYGEKLATPDITIADLIGEVDPIKVAEGRYLSDELTIHYGLLPRVNRGIFAVNELPDLAERIQVGLLNVLEERDIQIRGHRVRLPLDVFLVATANPEDYTNRGRIITPLKDRYGAQIRTHYPEDLHQEIEIMEQEALHLDMGDYRVNVPDFMKEIIAEITHHARQSPDVNQRSGVSVRASVANYEALLANAFRRALRVGETEVVPRVSDLPFIVPSLQGKVEFEAMEDGQEARIMDRLIQGAVKSVFDRKFDINDVEEIAAVFNNGLSVEVGEGVASRDYADILTQSRRLGRSHRRARRRKRSRARHRDRIRARRSASAQAAEQIQRGRPRLVHGLIACANRLFAIVSRSGTAASGCRSIPTKCSPPSRTT